MSKRLWFFFDYQNVISKEYVFAIYYFFYFTLLFQKLVEVHLDGVAGWYDPFLIKGLGFEHENRETFGREHFFL